MYILIANGVVESWVFTEGQALSFEHSLWEGFIEKSV